LCPAVRLSGALAGEIGAAPALFVSGGLDIAAGLVAFIVVRRARGRPLRVEP